MADKPILSICIPTYKRSACLAELLDSILAQGLPDIEVVISDDASPDDTPEVAARYANRFGRFNFIRQHRNIGLDRNFLTVISAATADYVWLMGDDDKLEPGGARRVLDALARWPNVSGLTLGVIDYDYSMERPTGVRRMPETQLLTSIGQVFGELAELLGFMSALVVRREAWMEVAADPSVEEFMKYYVQVYIIGRMIQRYGQWGVVNEPCVGFRTDNDQFLAKFGWVDRLRIDVVAYDQLAGALLATDAVARKRMRQRIFDTHVMARIHNAKTRTGPTPDTWSAIGFLFRHYGNLRGYWIKALPTLIAPDGVIRAVRWGYKRFSKSSGAAKARQL